MYNSCNKKGIDMFNVDEFIRKAISIGASDIHLNYEEHPAIRKDGKIIKIDEPVLSDDDLHQACKDLAPMFLHERIANSQDIDFAYEIKNVARLRVNVGRRLGHYTIAIRIISYHVQHFDELCLPEEIRQFTELENGLVLITGPTGSGKSTTLAALLEHINANQQKHIITVEDPVEYIFSDKKSIVTQRQLLVDTPTFEDGIKYALRQDPDVILIGEIRDRETITGALRAAETGHLVFATIHTNNAIQTVNRIINMYNPADRPFVRQQISEVLRGTVSQKLLPLAEGNGRKPVCEILVVTPTIKDLIKKNELESIYDLVKKGSFDNMTTLNASIFKLLQQGEITEEVALNASSNVMELQHMIRGVYHGMNNINRK